MDVNVFMCVPTPLSQSLVTVKSGGVVCFVLYFKWVVCCRVFQMGGLFCLVFHVGDLFF